MNLYVMFFYVWFLLLSFSIFNIFVDSAENYGPTNIVIRKFENCRGPRRQDCSVNSVNVDSPTKLTQKLNVTENIYLTHGKIVGMAKGRELFKYPVRNPCNTVIGKSILKKYINITDNCMVVKGTFDLLIRKFEQCQGPKRKDCAVTTAIITNQRQLDFTIDVKENVKTTKGKIVVSVKGKETLRLQLKDPCKHLFLKPLLQTLLNTTSDCMIAKGIHNFNVDIQEVARKYYNGEFLFGTWTFKSVFYNDDCTFSCSVIEVSMVPKNSEKLAKEQN